MSNTFTPGEWESVGNLIMAKREKYSFCIGSVLGGGINNIQDKAADANAHLFAASKDMFSALTELIEIRQQRMISGDTRELMEKEAEAYNRAYVAIEKAVPKVTYGIPLYPSDY